MTILLKTNKLWRILDRIDRCLEIGIVMITKQNDYKVLGCWFSILIIHRLFCFHVVFKSINCNNNTFTLLELFKNQIRALKAGGSSSSN